MTKYFISINAMMIALNGAVVTGSLDEVFDTPVKAVISVVITILLAGLGPLLPVISEATRRTLNLQRRGN